jgi:hypothetical protein
VIVAHYDNARRATLDLALAFKALSEAVNVDVEDPNRRLTVSSVRVDGVLVVVAVEREADRINKILDAAHIATAEQAS